MSYSLPLPVYLNIHCYSSFYTPYTTPSHSSPPEHKYSPTFSDSKSRETPVQHVWPNKYSVRTLGQVVDSSATGGTAVNHRYISAIWVSSQSGGFPNLILETGFVEGCLAGRNVALKSGFVTNLLADFGGFYFLGFIWLRFLICEFLSVLEMPTVGKDGLWPSCQRVGDSIKCFMCVLK